MREYSSTVADVMSTEVFAVTPRTPVPQIANLFEREHIHRVPVGSDGVVVGIVSRPNLVRVMAAAPTEDTKVILSDHGVRDLGLAEYRRLPWGIPS
jgi:CBS domain-containing protein